MDLLVWCLCCSHLLQWFINAILSYVVSAWTASTRVSHTSDEKDVQHFNQSGFLAQCDVLLKPSPFQVPKDGKASNNGFSVGIEFGPPLFCFLLTTFEVSILSRTVCIFLMMMKASKFLSMPHPWLAVEGHYTPISLQLKLINSSQRELLTYNTIHVRIALLLKVLKPIAASPGHLRRNTSCSHSSSFM